MRTDRRPQIFRRKLRFFFHRWHRRTGIIASFLVLLLSFSGIALNHTGSLGLAQSYPQNSFILWPYQAVIPQNIELDLPFGRLTVSEQMLMLDNSPLADCSRILDYTTNGQEVLVACDSLWFLLNNIGELLDSIEPETLGLIGTENLQVAGSDLIIETSNGLQVFDTESLELSHQTVNAATELPVVLVVSENRVISWQRVILDIHSGRWFGSWGIWVMDAAAIALILLAFSGLWLWLSRRRSRLS